MRPGRTTATWCITLAHPWYSLLRTRSRSSQAHAPGRRDHQKQSGSWACRPPGWHRRWPCWGSARTQKQQNQQNCVVTAQNMDMAVETHCPNQRVKINVKASPNSMATWLLSQVVPPDSNCSAVWTHQCIVCQGVLDASSLVSHHGKGCDLAASARGGGDGHKLCQLAKRWNGVDTLADVLQGKGKSSTGSV